MMTEAVKLCVQCKHYHFHSFANDHGCMRKMSLVTGEPDRSSCADERKARHQYVTGKSVTCGPDGRYWEAK